MNFYVKKQIKSIKTINTIIGIVLMNILFAGIIYSQQHNWIRTNPGAGGAFNCIGAGPTGIVIAGSDLSGFYRSADDGANWSVIGKNEGLNTTHGISIGFDINNANIVLAGTDEGIYKSVDSGKTFPTQPLTNGYITNIKFSKSTSSVVYAAYHPAHNNASASIYKSTNNGTSWSKVSGNFNNRHILKIVVDPNNTDVVYFLTGQGRYVCGPAEIYKSTDGGISFTQIASSLGEIMDIAIDPVNSNSIYLSTFNVSCLAPYYWLDLDGAIYKSTNGGSTWSVLNNNLTGLIWIDRTNPSTIRLIDPREPYPWTAYKSSGTFQTTDGGTNWNKIGTVDNWDCGFYKKNGSCSDESIFWSYGTNFEGIAKTLGENLSNPNSLYWVNTQFVFRTSDGGVTFSNIYTNEVSTNKWQSRGIDNITLYDLSISKANPNVLYAAYFDIGLWRSLDNGVSWQSCNQKEYTGSWEGFGGNTYAVVSDPDIDGLVWAAMQGDFSDTTFILRSVNYGEVGSWELVHTGLPLNETAEISGLSVSKQSAVGNRTLLVCVNGDVYKSINHGNNWSKVLTNGGLRVTAIDKYNGSVMFAGGENGIFRSTDSGSTWSDISLVEMKGSSSGDRWDDEYSGIWNIKVDPVDTNVLYVTSYGNGAEKGLYKSTDQGNNWTKIYSGKYVRGVAIAPGNPNFIYLTSSSVYVDGNYDATANDGIFFSYNGGITWQNITENMTWDFGIPVAINSKSEPWVFVGVPGTGFQKSLLPSVKLQIKIFLEGAYNTTANEMNTSLNTALPTTSPYSENSRKVTSIPADVVDWVLIQLRETATGSTVVSKSAFLHKDGRVVADDGTTGEIELTAPEGNYYIVIKHRNHLAVMSKNQVSLNKTNSALYDFTTGSEKFYGSGGAIKLN